MSHEITHRPQARRDLIEHFVFIAQDSTDAAGRFLEAAQAAVEELATMPHLGQRREFRNPRLAGLRSRAIPGFENYLIFYLPTSEGIEVIRVLHGARDLESIFEP